MKQVVKVAAAVVGMCAVSAGAATYDLNYEFSGGTAPSGATPWVRVSVTDNLNGGGVTLVINNVGLKAAEFNSGTYINVADAFRGNLTFNLDSKKGSFASPGIYEQTGSQTSDRGTFKADGDGYFDVALAFSTASSQTFGAGESVSYTITSSIAGLSASAFDFTSDAGGGHGIWYAAAHIQAIAGGGSGWIGASSSSQTTAPDGGATVLLLGSALAGIGVLRGRFSSK